MSMNNYECPKCHNVFPESNKFLHDIHCTVNNPLPLNQSRILFLEENNNQNYQNNNNQNNINFLNFGNQNNQINHNQNNINNRNFLNQNNRINPFQNDLNYNNQGNINIDNQNNLNNQNKNNHNQNLPHRPQPRLGLRKEPISHRDIFHNIRESFMEMPQTFECWYCGQTLPLDQKVDHMLCHQLENENERNPRNEQNNLNQNERRQGRNIRPRDQSANISPRRVNPRRQINPSPDNRHNNNINNIQNPQPNNNQMPILNFDFNRIEENNNRLNNNRNRNNFVADIPSFRNENIFNNRLNQINRRIQLIRNNSRRVNNNVSLPETKLDNISSFDSEKKRCLICLCDYIIGDKVINLPCIHMYHSECIKSWLNSHDSCPLCKIKISDVI